VPRQHAFKALRLLHSLGYPAIPEFSAAAQSGILKHDLHYHILKPEDNIAVEIHWTLVPEYFRLDLPLNDWWKRMAPVFFDNRPILSFARKALRNPFKQGGNLSELLFQFRLKPTLAGRMACFQSYISTPLIIDYKTRVPRILGLFFRSLWNR
jgi:hypothetical protein